jgi:hypothetical protein
MKLMLQASALYRNELLLEEIFLAANLNVSKLVLLLLVFFASV